ncbi:hypothetical protein M0813_18304 [Anaeramoeba flamelloides]|uniref:Uncharacterized protein n=1 Tax=Anaeramoeba flamelloides TaxID=1746091 RepID=A0ABQ8YSR7_9EUKA|nr:hypothetical protein M0813_18304 [Anaeramoeba flamelloides]
MFKLINMICQFFQIQTQYFSDCYDLINQIEPFTGLIISKIALKQSLNSVLMSNINWLKQSGEKPLIRESRSQNAIMGQKFNNSFTYKQFSQLTKEQKKNYTINKVDNKNKTKRSTTNSLENQNNIKGRDFKVTNPLAISILPNYSTEEGQLQFEDDQLIEIIDKGDQTSYGMIDEKQGKFLSNLVMFVSEEQALELGYIELSEDGLSWTKTTSGYIKSKDRDIESDKINITMVSKMHKPLKVSFSLNNIVSPPEKPISLATSINNISIEYKNDSFLRLEKISIKSKEGGAKNKVNFGHTQSCHESIIGINSNSHPKEDN